MRSDDLRPLSPDNVDLLLERYPGQVVLTPVDLLPCDGVASVIPLRPAKPVEYVEPPPERTP